jgi:flavin-dependent dehydrogenase
VNAEVVVIGAGPAGCAAALAARRAGLGVIVLEAHERPRVAPGETLHPGIEPILAALGVWTRVAKAGFHRHCGMWNEIGGRRWFTAYGSDATGPWFGLQADRRILHTLLHEAVMETGAEIRRPVTPSGVLMNGPRVVGVRAGASVIEARWVFDATGHRAWLARRLALPDERHSPPLRLRFGWRRTSAPELDGQPLFRQSNAGWTWYAPVTDARLAWVQLQVDPSPGVGRVYAWRLHGRAAGPGYFVLGDAAALLDPAASNGVLRAMMSGMLAAHLVHAVGEARMSEATATQQYIEWIEGMFLDSAAELRRRGLSHAGPRVPVPIRLADPLASAAWAVSSGRASSPSRC